MNIQQQIAYHEKNLERIRAELAQAEKHNDRILIAMHQTGIAHTEQKIAELKAKLEQDGEE